MKFCKKCGTLYDDGIMECPKCTGKMLDGMNAGESVYDMDMPEEEVARQRKRNWIQLIIGVPAMIGLFYAVFGLFKYLISR